MTFVPLIKTSESTISLVVPGVSVTIAFSSSIKEFKSVDFPTLGSPKIKTRKPSTISFPRPYVLRSELDSAIIPANSFKIILVSTSGISSSGKSTRASISAKRLTPNSLRLLNFFVTAPEMLFVEQVAAASD